jgi:hypothetical protein
MKKLKKVLFLEGQVDDYPIEYDKSGHKTYFLNAVSFVTYYFPFPYTAATLKIHRTNLLFHMSLYTHTNYYQRFTYERA